MCLVLAEGSGKIKTGKNINYLIKFCMRKNSNFPVEKQRILGGKFHAPATQFFYAVGLSTPTVIKPEPYISTTKGLEAFFSGGNCCYPLSAINMQTFNFQICSLNEIDLLL